MFAFPSSTASDLVRNSIESQFSMFTNLSKNIVNTSMKLGELNVQASRKLMEESAAALQKAMQLRTAADTQSFIAEQSQVTMERIQGYALNVQNIASQNWSEPARSRATHLQQPGAQPETTDDTVESKAAASPGHQHEADPHPSPLVEKLVASVVNDADKLH